jgi:hypothetical protein
VRATAEGIARLSSLRALRLNFCPRISDSGMVLVAEGCVGLELLEVASRCHIGDPTLAAFAKQHRQLAPTGGFSALVCVS